MRQTGRDKPIELRREPVRLIGRQIELEQLDRDEPLAIGVVRAENGSERPGADLMKNAKRSKGVGRRSSLFGVQR